MSGTPEARLRLTVTGPTVTLEHRGTIRPDVVTLDAEVHPGESRRLELPPAFLTAALVRLTRMRPRRPDDTGPAYTWELSLEWEGDSRHLSAQDEPGGLQLVDPDDGALRAASNTEVYRVLSTLLPTLAG